MWQITSQLQISESAIAPLVSRAINSRAEATDAISGCVFVCSCEGMTSFVLLSVMLEKYDSASFHDRIRQKREFIQLIIGKYTASVVSSRAGRHITSRLQCKCRLEN